MELDEPDITTTDQERIAPALLGPTAALPVLRRAAATAPTATALELLDTALGLMAPDDVERYAVLAAKARVLVGMGDASGAVAEASALVPRASDLATRLRLHVTAVLGRMAQGEVADPVPGIEQWLAELAVAATDLTPEDASALAEYALVQLITGHPMGAVATIDLIPEADDEVLAILVGTGRTVAAMYQGRMDDAIATASVVRDAVERTDRLAEVSGYVPLLVCGSVAARAGRVDEGVAAIAAARTTMRAFGLVSMESICDANVAAVLLEGGRWDDALALVDEGLAIGDDQAQLAFAPWLLAVRSLVHARRGDLVQAEQACAEAALGHPVLFNGLDHLLWARATIAGARRDERAQLRALDDLVEAVASSGVEYLPSPMGLDVVRARLAAGDAAQAARAAALLPTSSASPVVAAMAAAAHGLLAHDPAQIAEAADGVESAFPYEAARLWEDAAVASAARGRSPADAATRAATTYHRLGAATDLDRLRRRVPTADVTVVPAERSGSGLDALTPTETRITRLVASGCSNAEIAEQLSVSRRTVESHLARVFTKVGVRSRLQLAVLAQDAAG